MGLREKMYEAGVVKNWGFFRDNYESLTIDDLVWINTKWDSVLPYQKSHSLNAMVKMFSSITENNLKVVELGSYRSFLGSHLIEKVSSKVAEWHGYDINHAAIEDAIIHPQIFNHKLSKWFWEVDVSGYDIFVSSHTLEHFSFEQLKKIVETVSICKYLVLEIPLQNNWRGFRGSHVLLTTVEEVESLISATHIKLIDCSRERNWVVSLWRKN